MFPKNVKLAAAQQAKCSTVYYNCCSLDHFLIYYRYESTNTSLKSCNYSFLKIS